MSTPDDTNGRSIEELVQAARDEGHQWSGTGDADAGAELGGRVWLPSASATEEMLSISDHSASVDEPGKYGKARVASERAAVLAERGVGTVRSAIAQVDGATRRVITLRKAVGHSWHRRIPIEARHVLSVLIVAAVLAEMVFASTAAEAVGLYDWKRYLFGLGAAIAYLGLGAYLGRILVGEAEVRSHEGTTDANTSDPVVRGRNAQTKVGRWVLVGALAIWLAGTTGLTILRESNAEQVAARQKASRVQEQAKLEAEEAANGTASSGTASSIEVEDTRDPLMDFIAMWLVATLIGAGIAFMEAGRSDPVVHEWRDSTQNLARAVENLDEKRTTLRIVEMDRREALEVLRDHHDALAHRAQGHAFLPVAQELAYRQFASSTEAATEDADAAAGTSRPHSHGHDGEISHHLERAKYIDSQVLLVEHYAAVVRALAEGAQGIQPDGDYLDHEKAIADQVSTWLTDHPPYIVVDMNAGSAGAAPTTAAPTMNGSAPAPPPEVHDSEPAPA